MLDDVQHKMVLMSLAMTVYDSSPFIKRLFLAT